MQKQAPTLGRLLVMVGFALSCFGLLLFLWLAFGGAIPLAPKGYRFQTSFGEATQLAKEADVRISGVSVGKVKDIETNLAGRSEATIQIDDKYAPIPKNTKAILRQKTLLGETYVELTPGNRAKGNLLQENGRLPASQVSATVELDEIFRAFDPKTRAAFQSFMQDQAVSLKGRGKDISDALGNLAPFAEDANTLVQILNSQQLDVRRLINNTGTVFDALTARDDELASLITNSNRVFSTTARRNADIQALFRVLPTFNREAKTTTDRLTTFARDSNPLIDQLRPAARELSPTLVQLQLLAPDLRGLFRSLDPLIRQSRTGLPALQGFLDDIRPFLGEFDAPLRQLNPILAYIGAYKEELNSFFANTVASTEATDFPPKAKGPVHYLRTTNPFNLENLAVYPNRLPTNRPNPYELPGAFSKLGDGLFSYETRQCDGTGGLLPTIVSPQTVTNVAKSLPPPLNKLTPQIVNAIVPSALVQQINKSLSTGVSGSIAPPCKQQRPFTTSAGTQLYPKITAAPSGQATPVVPASPAVPSK